MLYGRHCLTQDINKVAGSLSQLWMLICCFRPISPWLTSMVIGRHSPLTKEGSDRTAAGGQLLYTWEEIGSIPTHWEGIPPSICSPCLNSSFLNRMTYAAENDYEWKSTFNFSKCEDELLPRIFFSRSLQCPVLRPCLVFSPSMLLVLSPPGEWRNKKATGDFHPQCEAKQ